MKYNEPPANACRRLAVLIVLIIFLSAGHALAAGPKDKVLYSFQGADDGAVPKGGLIVDRAGNLYGTTYSGGSQNFKGTVFQLSPPSAPGNPWTENVLYDFPDLSAGENPWAGLTADAAGNLYGTTWLGGPQSPNGVVFELSPPSNPGNPWTYTVLYNFTGGSDGGQPQAGVVFDKAGNLYGTTEIGGAPVCMGGCGVVFKLTPPAQQGSAWTETSLYAFSNLEGGTTAGVIVDSKGAVYGTTVAGGNGPCLQGCGTVFQLVPPPQPGGKWTHRVLYNFQGGNDGIQPEASLVLDSKHNLYGTTITDGTGVCFTGGPGCGTVFELSPPTAPGAPWTEAILYKFLGGNDGIEPLSPLIFDRAGNLYGTTEIGGNGGTCLGAGCGTVFKLTPPAQVGGAWTESVLYRFTGGTDGFVPLGVVFGRGGALYGTTRSGDTAPACFGVGCGTVFSVLP